jgi:hypothetical protein
VVSRETGLGDWGTAPSLPLGREARDLVTCRAANGGRVAEEAGLRHAAESWPLVSRETCPAVPVREPGRFLGRVPVHTAGAAGGGERAPQQIINRARQRIAGRAQGLCTPVRTQRMLDLLAAGMRSDADIDQ